MSGPAPVARRAPVAAAAGLGVAVSAAPSVVEAHLVSTGLGPVYDGLVHFVLTPEDLVPVLALALLAGLRGVTHGRWVLLVLPAAWLLGGVLGLWAHAGASPVLTAVSFVLLGGLVAADARLPLTATAALAALLGLAHGYLNGTAMAQPGLGAPSLLGVVVAVFVFVALAASVAASLPAGWARVVVRVVGSWIAAIGLLLLGWGLRPGA